MILKTLPVPAVSNVLLVRVSVVALPIKVSVAAGRVRTPDAVPEAAIVVTPVVPLKFAPAEPIIGVVNEGELARTAEPVPVTAVT